jgi:hypothetical protein
MLDRDGDVACFEERPSTVPAAIREAARRQLRIVGSR